MQGQNKLLGETILKNSGEGYSSNIGQHADFSNNGEYAELVGEDMDVPEIVEEILELLLSSLRDSVC